jgi:hypothetical protein
VSEGGGAVSRYNFSSAFSVRISIALAEDPVELATMYHPHGVQTDGSYLVGPNRVQNGAITPTQALGDFMHCMKLSFKFDLPPLSHIASCYPLNPLTCVTAFSYDFRDDT